MLLRVAAAAAIVGQVPERTAGDPVARRRLMREVAGKEVPVEFRAGDPPGAVVEADDTVRPIVRGSPVLGRARSDFHRGVGEMRAESAYGSARIARGQCLAERVRARAYPVGADGRDPAAARPREAVLNRGNTSTWAIRLPISSTFRPRSNRRYRVDSSSQTIDCFRGTLPGSVQARSVRQLPSLPSADAAITILLGGDARPGHRWTVPRRPDGYGRWPGRLPEPGRGRS